MQDFIVMGPNGPKDGCFISSETGDETTQNEGCPIEGEHKAPKVVEVSEVNMIKCVIVTEPVFSSSYLNNPKENDWKSPCTKEEIVSHELELSIEDYLALEKIVTSGEQHNLDVLAPRLYKIINQYLSYYKESEETHDYIITKVYKKI